MYQRKKNLKNLVVSFLFFSVAHISYLACVFTNFFWRFFSFGAFSCHLICGHEAARAAVLAADGHLALLGVLWINLLAWALRVGYSVYLLYWYKNTDAREARC